MEQLQVSNLAKTFVSYRKKLVGAEPIRSTEALRDVSFSIGAHEFVSIVGPSGCGKTTTLRIIAGIEEPTSGDMYVQGRRSRGPSPQTSMVFQNIGLYPWLTVEENVLLALEFLHRRKPSQTERARARDYLAMVGLEEFLGFYPHQLSGGMQQRVGLARALVTQPAVLLMDEPFGLLDAQTRSVLQDELMALHERLDQSVLFVTHDIDESVYLSDRVLVMSGRPGTISLAVDVDLSRPRSQDQRSSAEFSELRNRVWTALREEAILASRGITA